MGLFSGIRKISIKIQLVIGVTVLGALVVLGAALSAFLTADLNQYGQGQLETTSKLIVSMTEFQIHETIRQHLETEAKVLRDLAEFYYNQSKAGVMSSATAYATFKTILLKSPMAKIGDTGYMAAVSGKGIAVIHPNSEGKDFSSLAFMQQAMAQKNGFLEYKFKGAADPVERDKVGGMSYFEPWDLIIWASSYKSEFLSLLDVPALTTRLSDLAKGSSVEVMLVDRQGKAVLNPYSSQVNLTEDPGTGQPPWVKQILDKTRGTLRFIPQGEKGPLAERFAAFLPLESVGWEVVVAIPQADLSRMAFRALGVIAAVSLVLFLFLILATWALARSLTKPLNRTVGVLEAAMAGNLSLRAGVKTSDEVGRMGLHLDNLLEMLNGLLGQVRDNSRDITDMVQGLSASTQEISATANEQAAAVKEIVSTIEDTNHLSKNISTRVEEVSRIANDTKHSVEDGFATVQNSISKMNEIHDANTKTITGINFLSEKIKNIWDIVNIINNIADQTKIIAFNAELEASSAGDAGKNFQIVASEIRRLADSTVNSTNEIKARIQEIERSSDALLLSSEQGTERILQGKDLSQKVNQLFGDISSSAEISDTSTQAIALSIRQQVGAFDQIVIAIKQISQGVDNFVVATRSTSATTENLRRMAGNLKDLIRKFEAKD